MKEHKQYYRIKKDFLDIVSGSVFKRVEIDLGMRAFYAPVGAKITILKDEGIACPVATVGHAPAHMFAQMYVENSPLIFESVADDIEFGSCPNCETVNEFRLGKNNIECKTCKRKIKLIAIN